MKKKLFSLLCCLIFICCSAVAFAEDETPIVGESDSGDVVRHTQSGEVITNGMTSDGKIFIGVGRPEQDAATQQHVENTINAAGSENAVKGLQLVENMRALKGKIGHYAADGTNCVRTIGIAFQGTPYGTDTNYAVSGGYGVGGYQLDEGQMVPLVNCEQLVAIARDLHQLIDSNNCQDMTAVNAYHPMPGDIAIGYFGSPSDKYQHAVVAKLNDDGSIGTIQNGSSHDGVYESDLSPSQMMDVACYITSSVYAGFPIDTDLVSYLPGGGGPGGGGGGGVGGRNNAVSFEALMTIGESLNKIILTFSEVSKQAYGNIVAHAFDLIALLAIIDLTITILLSGFEINPVRLFVKVLKYGFIYWVVIWWPDIIDVFMQSMVVSVNQTVNPDQFAEISRNVCQPHLMLQKVIYLLKPGFDFVKNLSWIDTIKYTFTGGWFFYLLGGLCTFLTMFVYFLFAAYIAYVYIVFFVYAGLSVISLPFMASGFTKFFPEGVVGSVWTAAVRLMVLSFMIGLLTCILPDAGFEAVRTAGAPEGASNGLLVTLTPGYVPVFIWYVKQCGMLILLAFFSVKVTDSITGKLGGRFEMQI